MPNPPQVPARFEARLVVVLAACLLGVATLGFPLVRGQGPAQSGAGLDKEGSRQAFLTASRVLLHPRCVNCHAAGDKPTQNDNNRPHKGSNLQRGPDGRGVAPFACVLCHKATNSEARPISSPGAPDWRMPPAVAAMIFAKRRPAQICAQFKKDAEAGGPSPAQIVEHIKQNPFVKWAWEPGQNRTKPSLTFEQFTQAMEDWAGKGAFCPE